MGRKSENVSLAFVNLSLVLLKIERYEEKNTICLLTVCNNDDDSL